MLLLHWDHITSWMNSFLFLNFSIMYIFHLSMLSIELLILIWFHCQSRQSLQELQAAGPFCKRMSQCGNLSQLWSPWVRILDLVLMGLCRQFGHRSLLGNCLFFIYLNVHHSSYFWHFKKWLVISILLDMRITGLVWDYHVIG